MALLRRINLERTGKRIVVALTILTLLMVAVSAVMRVAAEDLYAAVNEARGSTDVATRTAYGRWLAAHLSGDLPAGDLDAEHARADALSFRSDRLRELAAVPAVVGLLVALLTDAPEATAERHRGPRQSTAQGATNGRT